MPPAPREPRESAAEYIAVRGIIDFFRPPQPPPARLRFFGGRLGENAPLLRRRPAHPQRGEGSTELTATLPRTAHHPEVMSLSRT